MNYDWLPGPQWPAFAAEQWDSVLWAEFRAGDFSTWTNQWDHDDTYDNTDPKSWK